MDLPGQGLNPDDGLFLEAEVKGVEAVLDWAAADPEVDTKRLALFGFSWGGHIVLKGAGGQPLVKALVAIRNPQYVCLRLAAAVVWRRPDRPRRAPGLPAACVAFRVESW